MRIGLSDKVNLLSSRWVEEECQVTANGSHSLYYQGAVYRTASADQVVFHLNHS